MTMKNKLPRKAQGLPLTTIAIAILVFLTLVVVVLFATGSFGKLFGTGAKLTSAAGGEVGADQATCNSLCSSSLQLPSTANFIAGGYCTKAMKYDTNKDGKIDINDGGGDGVVRCWEDPVAITCSGTLGSGDAVSNANCPP
ncbi:MAG: hypothetical protein HY438_02730 [DPANN group archaeon]|nr:hypothetical protein [DPANN group archaeon]